VAKNPSEAFNYVRTAAKELCPPAMVELARYYAEGVGTEPDLCNAYIWAELAARCGEPSGTNLAARLTKLLPFWSRARAAREAQSRARQLGIP
jgi:TPR repeat protein